MTECPINFFIHCIMCMGRSLNMLKVPIENMQWIGYAKSITLLTEASHLIYSNTIMFYIPQ